ncbi:efflux transporter outer membrane subunit [Iodidimonas sp. SYSU 1G8]|uniref:efflux transporter outer membrane subunit n=1 Tax=Iodidimonas sp. SYSU 1G8 TaxID=3133967 RepID=UPI0031FF2212
MMHRLTRILLIGASSAALAACGAAATRPLPTAELQQSWEGTPDGAAISEAPPIAWWREFDDPVLDRLIETAESRNLDLRLAQSRVAEARALRKGARAELFPELTGGGDAERSRTRPRNQAANPGPTRTENTFGLSLGASWEADLFGRLQSEARAASADLEATEADRDAVRLTLLAEVARTYLEYRLYQAQAGLAQKNADAQGGTVRITRARFDQGMSSRFDLERIIAQQSTTRAAVPQAREQAESARHRLVLLLATTPEQLNGMMPPDSPMPDADPVAVLATPTQVVALRPDVRAAERRLLAASERVRAAQALRYPQITLSGLLGVESARVGDLFSPGTRVWSAGASLLQPLFDFGRIRAAIDAADARQEQAYLDYELTVRTALQEAQTAIVLYTEGVIRQRELGNAVTAAAKAAELANRQYKEGTLSLLEVLDAERALYEAETQWTSATADVALRLVSLYQTMGIVPPATPTLAAGG